MNKFFFSFLLLFIVLVMNSYAQKQTFDVISFSAPKGWQQQKNESGLQLSVSDKQTGAYAIVVITKAAASTASANENFNNDWLKLVKGSVQVNDKPAMEQPANDSGWNIIAGGANYTDGANKGMATLLTATGSGQTASVVIMTNTQRYQNDLMVLLNSLEWAKPSQKGTINPVPATTSSTGNPAMAGLWIDYNAETTGAYFNGMPQYTAGYTRREYAFYADGSYLFREKQWLTTMKEILFVYETGTYSVNGNQLTINPQKGMGGWWNKVGQQTNEWGKRLKAAEHKMEKVTYVFEIRYFSGSQDYTLILRSGKSTQRDGGTFNNANAPNEFHYSLRENFGSLIDNPPGFKTGFENKSFAVAAVSQERNETAGSTNNSPLTEKIWEGSSSEKFTGAGAITGDNTGGFSTAQYQFNADGTYRFVNVRASHYTDTKTLEYETGTYAINSNQLTISPVSGGNEEWSKIGKTSNGNSDVTNRAINETWGKKMKIARRKLEKYTYTFSIGKNGDKHALILQRSGSTEREGKIAYYNQTSPEKSVKLPVGIK